MRGMRGWVLAGAMMGGGSLAVSDPRIADRAGDFRIRVQPLNAGSFGSYILSVTRIP